MMHFHPDLIATVHDDRMDRRRSGRATAPRRGEDVRWVRPARAGRDRREA